MNNKKIFLLSILLLLSGCSDGADPVSVKDASATAHNITYFKDDRTGLCFGSVLSTTYYGYQVMSITAVPCSEVEQYLVNKK